MTDEHAIVETPRNLAASPAQVDQLVDQLAREAAARPLKDWAAVADDVTQRIVPLAASAA